MQDKTLVETLAAELGGLFEGDFKDATSAMVADPPPNEPTAGLQEKIDAQMALADVPDDTPGEEFDRRLDLLVAGNEALKAHIAREVLR